VYSQAPIVRNELINRDRPSATAIAGRKKLMLAMLEKPGSEDLGLKISGEKHVPAVLKATNLHSYVSGR